MSNNTRRNFIKKASATAVVAPTIIKSAKGQDTISKRTVASVGVGGSRGRYNRGGNIANSAAKLGKMIAVCDVDDRHAAEFSKKHGGIGTYRDYREMIEKEKPDVVTIGTPDHWHVPISIAALRAGCDVYCEKPLTLTIEEGIKICEVVKETGKVFQVGTQQRSEMNLNFLRAVAIVQSGRLGKNVNAYVAIGGAPKGDVIKSEEVPEDLDWNMWLGPAPMADYSETRRKMFRWFFEYSGGKMTDWGAHHIDIAQWALGKSDTGPVSVIGQGNFTPIVPDSFDWVGFLNGEAKLPSSFNPATEFNIDLKFDDGAIMSVHNHYKREDGTNFPNGILFEGEDGRIFVNRGKLTGKPIDQLTKSDEQDISDRGSELYKGKQPGSHMKNFFECLEDRTDPISDVYTHHRTMTSCHLCNISLMLGRELKWDPKKQQFEGDDQANALKSRTSREGFEMPS